ncbi:unnamed protein product [Protopolystoma xenopodis]|uniref:glycerol-3-phosphate dehydrogenase n=1 Tax=Protopolystoma xenopodis TaxID=117903 RepID=A0A448WMB8_9PLAT|nr:unnamed protein product [Protopolystoma xenopodis]
MCLSLALTACRYGASLANYLEVVEIYHGPPHPPKVSIGGSLSSKQQNIEETQFMKGQPKSTFEAVEGEPPQVVCGALMRDRLTGREFLVKARCVINATGPYTDLIRQLDHPSAKKICQPSLGVHITLPGYYR